ncbi:MAG: hypothetical protein QNK04_25560 [Myxococcota bacterium]|nr:hypothetical protein [Myxococcota bacterium]
MACCAFALFLVGQALAFFAALRRRMPIRRVGEPGARPRVNPATAWQLGQQPALAGGSGVLRGRGARRLSAPLVLAICLEATLVVGGVGWVTRHLSAGTDAVTASLQPADSAWCGRSSGVSSR